jgi:hypothetical protein
MDDAALRSPATALSEARLDALSDLWAEMGRFHNDSTTAGSGPAIALPWPALPPPRPLNILEQFESIDNATTFG